MIFHPYTIQCMPGTMITAVPTTAISETNEKDHMVLQLCLLPGAEITY